MGEAGEIDFSKIDFANEANKHPLLQILRAAIDSKNREAIRQATNFIQVAIQGVLGEKSVAQSSPLTDHDIEQLIKTGEACIYIGTGTQGERIYIKDDEIYMPLPVDRTSAPALQSSKYWSKFRTKFNLAADEENLRLKF